MPASVSTTPPPVVPDEHLSRRSQERRERERRFGPLEQRVIVRGLYLGRTILAAVLLVRSALVRETEPELAFSGMMVVLTAFAATGYGLFVTYIRRSPPRQAFLHIQAAMDLVLVTALVHFEGSGPSGWAALYVLVIAVYALLMPLRASVLTALLGAAIFLADAWVRTPDPVGGWLWGQVGAFTVVFLVVATLGQRLQLASVEHSELAIELHRVRLEADEILRNIRSGVMTVDGGGILAFINVAAEHLLGLNAAEHVGRPVLDELERRSTALWAAVVAGIRQSRRVSRAEGTAARPDGHAVPIGLSTTILERRTDTRPTVTAIFTDISDLQVVQELQRRAERLEAVASLSASLAHEIRNPLASIRSSVEQLARSAGKGDDERVLADLVVRESDRLNRLLGEFLDFSRVRAGHFQPLDLTAVVREAARLVREHPDTGSGVEIVVQGDPVEVEADEDLLHRIVSNLLLNSAQAMNGAGLIEAIVDVPAPSALPRGSEFDQPVRLRIRDNGPGIDPDLLPRLFQPFVSGRIGGTGLGLAIVQRAVAAHRGLVYCESAQREGTTFTILLHAKWPMEEVA